MERIRHTQLQHDTSSSTEHVAMWKGNNEGKGGTHNGSKAHKTNQHATINAHVRTASRHNIVIIFGGLSI